jgi:cell division protein FtsB
MLSKISPKYARTTLRWRRRTSVCPLRWTRFAVSTFSFACSKFFARKISLTAYSLVFRVTEVAAQAATDKSLLKAQVEDLAAENASLKTKADGLAVEVAQLRADQAKAQELVDKHQAEAESKERSLQQRL